MACFLKHGSMTTTCSDAELVARFRAGEQHAFDALVARHRPALRAYVARLLRDGPEVDDVLQDVFSRGFVALRDGNQPMQELRGWLFRVARNRVIDMVRATRPAVQLHDEIVASPRAASDLEVREALRQTMHVLRELPGDQRRALVLNAVHGEPYAEVARVLDISTQAAKSLAFRGRANARRAMTTSERRAA